MLNIYHGHLSICWTMDLLRRSRGARGLCSIFLLVAVEPNLTPPSPGSILFCMTSPAYSGAAPTSVGREHREDRPRTSLFGSIDCLGMKILPPTITRFHSSDSAMAKTIACNKHKIFLRYRSVKALSNLDQTVRQVNLSVNHSHCLQIPAGRDHKLHRERFADIGLYRELALVI